MSNQGKASQIHAALTRIAVCKDAKQLRQIAANALRLGEQEVHRAACLRLYDILTSAKPDSLEYDVWRSIHALEDTLTTERGKTTRLARTRQKIDRDGEHKTVEDIVLGKVSDGFRMLIDRAMAQLTFEWVVLRHINQFDHRVIAAATTRLVEAGFNPN